VLATAGARRYRGRVARTWLSLTVELVEGAGFRFWPRPGRVFAVGRRHTFEQLATVIDVSFGRWDLSHLWQFELPGQVFVAPDHPDWESGESDTVLAANSRLSRLVGGDEFVYEFDLGDSWLHICRVAEARIDPAETLGDVPEEPTAYDGWGILPDQYLRRFAEDDGEAPEPPDQRNRDLPPFRPWWGAGAGDAKGGAADGANVSDG
jgi:pRiA4b ORF-3-like protein